MLLGVLLILFFACFFYLASRNLLWGLILIAAFLPSYLIRFEILGIPLTVLEGMILISAAIWLIKSGRKNLKSQISNLKNYREWRAAIGLFLLAATVAVFVSPDLRAALGIWKAYFIEPALFFLVLVTTVKNRVEAEKIILGLVLGALPVAIFAVIQKFTGWLIPNPFWAAEATRRVTSVFGYPNAVALYLAPIVPFCIYLLIKVLKEQRTKNKEQNQKMFFIACSLLLALGSFLLAIIFAQSAGALLALATVAALAGLIYKKTRYWAVGVVVLFFLIVPFTSFREPLSQEVLLRGRSGQLRLNMWGETVEMLRARPIFGAGLAGYQSAVEPYHILNWAEIYLYPHNLFLNFWTETGLAGLAGFLLLVLNFYRLGIKRTRNDELGIRNQGLMLALLAAMTVILIHGLVDAPYFKNDLAIMFWLLLGLMF